MWGLLRTRSSVGSYWSSMGPHRAPYDPSRSDRTGVLKPACQSHGSVRWSAQACIQLKGLMGHMGRVQVFTVPHKGAVQSPPEWSFLCSQARQASTQHLRCPLRNRKGINMGSCDTIVDMWQTTILQESVVFRMCKVTTFVTICCDQYPVP